MSKVLYVLCIPGESRLNQESDPGIKDRKLSSGVDAVDVAKNDNSRPGSATPSAKKDNSRPGSATPSAKNDNSQAGSAAPSSDRSRSEPRDKTDGLGDQASRNQVESANQNPPLQNNIGSFPQSDKGSVKQKPASGCLGNFITRRKSLPMNGTQANNSEKIFKSSKSTNALNQDGADEKDVGKKGGKNKNKESGMDAEDSLKETEYFCLIDQLPLMERVKNTLARLDITSVHWTCTPDDMNIGMFISGGGQRCEEILDKLTMIDIGAIPGSSVSVFPASISIASSVKEGPPEKMEEDLEKEGKLAEIVSEFKKSIKSRLIVAQVVDSVKSDAIFTFDFLMLILLASLVALMGLLEASSVTLVASMLISPLMGPILAFVFGTVIKNKELMSVGISSELKGLALCIIVGFLAGCIPAGLESAGLAWRSTESWPTIEMSSRGAARSLLVGVLIALPSGAGVALSILGGKVGSLVGVAISASLLPPAVNAGLLWANALIVNFIPPKTDGTIVIAFAQNISEQEYVCPALLRNDYVPIYSCNMALESVVLGVISLLLTIINIICIILMGIAVLKIKEVAPIRSAPEAEKDFFARDLKVARESYVTTKGPNSTILGSKFLQEYRKMKGEIGVDDDSYVEDELNELLEDVEDAEDVQEILDKLPHRPKRWSTIVDDNDDLRNPYHTFHGAANHGVRKRVGFEEDNKIHAAYLTVHRAITTHTPRASHFSPMKWSKKSKGRFHVARVEEDNHNNSASETKTGSTAKTEVLPVIEEQESMPLLTLPAKRVE